MSTNLAWNIAGVGPQTRHVAEEAARRAGMRLEDWLDEAIAEQAAELGPRSEEHDGEYDWPDAIERRLERISRRERAARSSQHYSPAPRGNSRPEHVRGREGEDLLGPAIERSER